jgi:hypothetical protein
MQSRNAEISEWRVKFLLKEFGCKSEEELNKKLNAPIDTLPCQGCGRETNIQTIRTINGNPYCPNCSHN